HLQRAVKGEPIDLFEAARIQSRVERARKALREGDLEFASEILNDLQLEGRVDSEISLLLEEVMQATREKIVQQLLDTARIRLHEWDSARAWHKVEKVPKQKQGNKYAKGRQAELKNRRSDQQVDKWRRLVSQHLHNKAFTQARQAIEEIRRVGHGD